MVPGVFVHLDKLPLNQSGKLDRKALASTEIKTPEINIQPPINHIEKHICEIFGKVLNKENVGRNSNFFELDALFNLNLIEFSSYH